MKKKIWYFAVLFIVSCTEPEKKEEGNDYDFVLNEDTSRYREHYLAADESNNIGKKSDVPTDSTTYSYFSIIARNYLIDNKPYEALKFINKGSKVVKNKARYYFDKSSVWALIPLKSANDSMHFYLDLAVTMNPKDPYYHFIRSKYLNESGKNKEALESINKAIQLSPAEKSFINQRGMYEVATRNFSAAISDLRNVSSSNINNFEFYKLQAIAYNQMDMHADALEASENALQLDSLYAQGYVIKGSAFHYLGREEESIKAFYKASSLGDSTAIEYIKRHEKKSKKRER